MATSGVLCPAPEVIGLWLLLLKVCHGTFHVSPGGRSSKPVAAPQARPKQFLTGNLPIADGTRASISFTRSPSSSPTAHASVGFLLVQPGLG
jgi:hypothetical protein